MKLSKLETKFIQKTLLPSDIKLSTSEIESIMKHFDSIAKETGDDEACFSKSLFYGWKKYSCAAEAYRCELGFSAFIAEEKRIHETLKGEMFDCQGNYLNTVDILFLETLKKHEEYEIIPSFGEGAMFLHNTKLALRKRKSI